MQQDEVDHIKTRSETRYHSYAPPKRSTPRVQVGCCVVAVGSAVLAFWRLCREPVLSQGDRPQPRLAIQQSSDDGLLFVTGVAVDCDDRRPLPAALCLQAPSIALSALPACSLRLGSNVGPSQQKRGITAVLCTWNCQESMRKSGAQS